MTTEFYKNTEEPIRELVKLLRDNGVNTICSCGHEMWIQVEIEPSGQLKTMNDVTYIYLAEQNLPIEFMITMRVEKNVAGLTRSWAEINLKPNKEAEMVELKITMMRDITNEEYICASWKADEHNIYQGVDKNPYGALRDLIQVMEEGEVFRPD